MRKFTLAQKVSHNKKIHQPKVVVTAGDGTKVTFVRRADLTFYCEPCKVELIGGATSVHQHADNCKFLRCVQGRGEGGREGGRKARRDEGTEGGTEGRRKEDEPSACLLASAVESDVGREQGEGARGKKEGRRAFFPSISHRSARVWMPSLPTSAIRVMEGRALAV